MFVTSHVYIKNFIASNGNLNSYEKVIWYFININNNKLNGEWNKWDLKSWIS